MISRKDSILVGVISSSCWCLSTTNIVHNASRCYFISYMGLYHNAHRSYFISYVGLYVGNFSHRSIILVTGLCHETHKSYNISYMELYHNAHRSYRISESGIHLVDGPSEYEGRLEIQHQTHGWGTICDDLWDDYDAQVVCRMFGVPGGEVMHTDYGVTNVQIGLDDVQCVGT